MVVDTKETCVLIRLDYAFKFISILGSFNEHN